MKESFGIVKPDFAALQMARTPYMPARFVLVDGPSRSGKTTVSRVLASFTNVEKEREETIFDYIGVLDGFGKITKDGSITFIRLLTDMIAYEQYIGRNVNFRIGDNTSVLKSPKWFQYIRRLFEEEGDKCLSRMSAQNPIVQLGTHHQLPFINIYFDALAERLSVIEMRRHPVDIIFDWERRGYTKMFGTSPRGFTPCIQHEGKDIYYLAAGKEKDWTNGNPIENTVLALYSLLTTSRQSYKNLSSEKKSRIAVIKFEVLLKKPLDTFEYLALFLNTQPSSRTPKMLKKAGFPREDPAKERDQKWLAIRENASKKTIALVDELISDYEEEWA